jgi:plasmid stability protein
MSKSTVAVLNVLLDSDTHRKFRVRAAREGRSMRKQAELILRAYVNDGTDEAKVNAIRRPVRETVTA